MTAVTGKPLSHYDRYVELVANVLANGLALATDREFLLSLDRSRPLQDAVQEPARESIRWRFAFTIDDIETQVRAQMAREIRNYWDANGDIITTHNGARLAFDAIAAQIEERAS